MDLLAEILKAEHRIRPYILRTPLMPSRYLSRTGRASVYLKLENEQHTGSFKARGAMNRVLSLAADERARGVMTASTGNHGLGVARALTLTNGKGTIYLPVTAESSKVEALKDYGVDLAFHGADSLETELHAKRSAEERGAVWISPYNDPRIIGGQGTIGIELAQRLPHIDAVFVTVGGGGLISGIATYLKTVRPGTRIIGCLPENAPDMYRCVQQGKIVTLEQHETLSDGSAGGVEPGSITFPICRERVDEYVLVPEDEIRAALRLIVDKHHKIIEGAAAVAVAAYLKRMDSFREKMVVIILCGGNISASKLKEIL